MSRIGGLFLCALLALGACADQSHWTPTIDMGVEQHPQTLAADTNICRQRAYKVGVDGASGTRRRASS